jgi:hypothetical protein
MRLMTWQATSGRPCRVDDSPSADEHVLRGVTPEGGAAAEGPARHQGLTLVHVRAQLEPCLTHKNTLHTLRTP